MPGESDYFPEPEQLLAAPNTQEQRNRILAAVAAGQPVAGNQAAPTVLRSFPAAGATQTEDGDKFASMQYRKAFMDYVVRGTAIPTEYRADAVTKTTSMKYRKSPTKP